MKKIFFLFLITSSHLECSQNQKPPLLKLKGRSPVDSRKNETVFTTIVGAKRLSKDRIERHIFTLNKSSQKFFIFSITYDIKKRHKHREAEIVSTSCFSSPDLSAEERCSLMLNQIISRERISIDAISRYEEDHNKHQTPINFVENYLSSSRITTSYQQIGSSQRAHTSIKLPKINEKS